MVTLLNGYPRSMGNPHQNFVAYNKKQRLKYIKKYIKKCDLYISVYKFTEIDDKGKPVRESALIDKVFFDFDSEQWLEDLIKVHNWCKEKNIVHRSHASGNGGHSLIFVKTNVSNKKEAIGNFQRWLQNELDLIVDKKIIGDIARIFRYPNTYNFKGRRFCIPIPPEVLESEQPMTWIYKRYTSQCFCNAWSGKHLLDLKEWDVPELLYMESTEVDVDLSEIDDEIETEYHMFPACVRSWLSTPKLSGDGKFLLILFLKDQIYTKTPFDHVEIISILKKTLDPNEFAHYFGSKIQRRHAGHNGLKFKSVMRKDYYMPDCEEIRKKGYCPEDCGRRHPIY